MEKYFAFWKNGPVYQYIKAFSPLMEMIDDVDFSVPFFDNPGIYRPISLRGR